MQPLSEPNRHFGATIDRRSSAAISFTIHPCSHRRTLWRNTMNRRSTLALTTTTLLCLAVALPAGDALAQQKQQASFTASAENSKYTQQLNVDVGDVPNHMVRIFD